MRFQDFMNAVEDLNSLHQRGTIRRIENKIINEQPNEVKYWSQDQHRAGIQSAKERFNELNSGIIYSDPEPN
jgi:hypothetical protein